MLLPICLSYLLLGGGYSLSQELRELSTVWLHFRRGRSFWEQRAKSHACDTHMYLSLTCHVMMVKRCQFQSCSILRSFGDTITSYSSLGALLEVIDKSNICEGNFEDHFVAMVESRKGAITNGTVSAYLDNSHTVMMHKNCALRTKCTAYRKNLRALHARQRNWK